MPVPARPRSPRRDRRPLAAAGLLLAPLALAAAAPARSDPAGAVGPDVTVYQLTDIDNNGSSGGVRGYSIGTTSCNVGDVPVNWCDNPGGCSGLDDRQHPVIAQNLYRLKAGRFEQIGMSWLKHGFLSTNSPAGGTCVGPGGQQCTFPPRGGDELGVGCTDTYGAGLNGSRPLGMRSEVNPANGFFPFPETFVPSSGVDQWVQVLESDLDPLQNPGAIYWAEGQYIADNDALAGNGFNNASYQRVLVGGAPSYDLSLSGSTVREQSAVRAWKAQDPLVELFDVDVDQPLSPTERFEVARRVTEPTPGSWHYEYVVRNMNSDRAGQRLTIDFADGAAISGVGFADIDHHSGEPYDTADWQSSVAAASSSVSWETDLHSVDPNANALRWATMFSFWFDSDAGPAAIDRHALTLFKPGSPCRVAFSFAAGFVFADDFETGSSCGWSSEH
jgi:hypothetical protein